MKTQTAAINNACMGRSICRKLVLIKRVDRPANKNRKMPIDQNKTYDRNFMLYFDLLNYKRDILGCIF